MTRVEVANAWLDEQRLDDRTLAMARAYVEHGLTYAQIGEDFGVSRQRVGQLLGPLGLANEQGPLKKAARVQALREAYDRIMEGTSTLTEEAARLDYKSNRSLRTALYDLGLRIVLDREEPPHGTMARYRSHIYACRCEECRRANRDRQAALKGTEPPQHGHSGYINYECRCQVCKEANRLYVRTKKAAQRQRKEVEV